MGEVLTQAKILARTKLNNLSEVRNLNLWGNDFSDIRVLRELRNVEVLSLSVNSITTLADLAHCTQLRELYLRKNKISELSEILYLTGLPHLTILWLSENPCCETPNYREYILAKLPNLQKLDNTDITDEEREVALKRSAGLAPLRPASIDANDFISPRHGFPSPRRDHGREGFNNVASPRRSDGFNQIVSPTRREGRSEGQFSFRASHADLGSPINSPKAAAPRRDFGAVQRSPTHGQASSRPPPRIYAADDAGVVSPRYTVVSPQGSSYVSHQRPSSAAVVPPLNFASARSPVRSLASELDGVSSAEIAARRRTDALEEEIRILRLAEDAERARESARAKMVASPLPPASPTRGASSARKQTSSEQRSARSSPSSPVRGSSRQSGGFASPKSKRSSVSESVALSPRASEIASSYTHNSSNSGGSGSGSVSSRHPFTSNHVYGSAVTSSRDRPSSARPAAGEKPNHVPVFARGLVPERIQEHGAPLPSARGSSSSSRPQTAAATPTTSSSTFSPRSPRGAAGGGASNHAGAPPLSPRSSKTPAAGGAWNGGVAMTPRSSYGQHAPPATQHNLMCAALAMLEEFDVQHLEWLKKATEAKIENLRR